MARDPLATQATPSNTDWTPYALKVDPVDASRVKARHDDLPMTTGDEERARRKADWEAEQARQYFEELALKKPGVELVQIGTPEAIGSHQG